MCEHDWNEQAALRLVIETGDEFMASIFPMAPKMYPVEYCRDCGALRIPPAKLTALRAAEEHVRAQPARQE